MISIENNFFLISIFEWLCSRNHTISSSHNINTFTKSEEISSHKVHQNGLCNIVSVVSCDNHINSNQCCSSIKCLTSKNSTESTIVSQSNFLNDLVHRPAVKFFITNNFERKLVGLLILFNSFKRIISISSDTFIDREKEEVQAIIIPFVQGTHNMCKHSGVFTTRSCDGYFLSRFKKFVRHNGIVDLLFKNVVETFLADHLPRLWS
mmetsp:Transcript_72657/g.84394  ORF Transcript_72657/g.84394 Transcript_72657/m.84394 type:complete len:207 (+) Transcript_72657:347-967(+)